MSSSRAKIFLSNFGYDLSQGCKRAKKWFVAKVDSGKEEIPNERTHLLKKSLSPTPSKLNEFKTDLSNQYQKAKRWVGEKLESEKTLRAKSVVKGAIKATASIYPIIDLLLSIIPITAPYYLGFKIAKYIITTIAILLSAYSAYQREVGGKDFNKQLEAKLIEVQKVEGDSEKLLSKVEELLVQDGYTVPNREQQHELDNQSEFKTEEKNSPPETTQEKSKLTLLAESKAGICARALINGALTASTLYYICDLLSTFIPITQAFEVVKKALIWGAFALGTISSYRHITKTLNTLAKLLHLENHIAGANTKLQRVEKSLGTPQELVTMLNTTQYNSMEQTGGKLEVVDVKDIETTAILPKSKFKKFTETRPIIYLRSMVNGAKQAVGVGYVSGVVVPDVPEAKIISGTVTFAIGSYRSYQKITAQIAAEKRLAELHANVEKSKKLVGVAGKILDVEEINIHAKNVPILGEEKHRDNSEVEAENILASAFDEIDLTQANSEVFNSEKKSVESVEMEEQKEIQPLITKDKTCIEMQSQTKQSLKSKADKFFSSVLQHSLFKSRSSEKLANNSKTSVLLSKKTIQAGYGTFSD